VKKRLADIRRSELEKAASIIGYDEVVFLGYRDSGMPGTDDNRRADAFVNATFAEVLRHIVEIVRRERPVLVLGYDSHELYPHPDHLKIHEVTVALADAAADPLRFPEIHDPWSIPVVAAPSFTMQRMRTLHEEMRRRDLGSSLQKSLDLSMGRKDDVTRLVRVNVRGFVERGRDALRAHATQVDSDGSWFEVPTDVVEEVYPFEDFELLHVAEGALEDIKIFERWTSGNFC